LKNRQRYEENHTQSDNYLLPSSNKLLSNVLRIGSNRANYHPSSQIMSTDFSQQNLITVTQQSGYKPLNSYANPRYNS